MEKLGRRAFLRQSAMTMAAAGAVASLPTLVPDVLGAVDQEAPALDSTAAGSTALSQGAPATFVAHVRDLSSGDISLFHGTQETVLRDPQLAARLARAIR